jgi:nucleoside-diphosphate-sugar epimerase
MMGHILVTGAGGYIGTVLVPQLLEEGHKVRAVDRFFFGRHLLTDHQRLEVVVNDTRYLRAEDFDDIDAVIDLAAISNDPSGELFQEATWAINERARLRAARLAKDAGVSRYILPSSCSVYGFQDADTVSNEQSPTNPLTTYAKANLAAEVGVLELADRDFTSVVIRQATVYGLSPRMRFDLAINGMTYGAWKTGRLPLMRDGSQWRPMVHVHDTSSAMVFLLTADPTLISGEIFNVGSEENVYQIGPLGQLVADTVPGHVDIEWYGDPDHRSYRVSFEKIENIGWKAQWTAEDGVAEIVTALEAGETDRTIETITLDWYRSLERYRTILDNVTINGALFDIPETS